MSEEATTGRINFDLDSVEAGPGPYVFTVKDERFQTQDPRDLDWKVLATVDTTNPFEMIETFFTDEDQDRFMKMTISGRQLDALIEKLVKHYDLPSARKDAANRGNLRGSRT